MFLSIIVYGFLCIVLFYCFSLKKYRREGLYLVAMNPSIFYYFRVVVGVLFFSFIAGVRWDVGIDYFSYLYDYERICQGLSAYNTNIEEGYLKIQEFLAYLNVPSWGYFAFIALLQLGFIVLCLLKFEKLILPYFGVLLICGGDFFLWMNAMRQSLVIAAFFFLLMLSLTKKRFIIYILGVVVLSTIHTTALLLLPLGLLLFCNLENFYVSRKIQYILFIGAIVLSVLPVWEYLLNYVDFLATLIGYDRYSSEVLERAGDRTVNFGARRIILFIIDVILIFYSNRLRKAFPSKFFGLVYVMYIIFFITQPLFINNLTFSRVVAYFYISRIIIASYLLCFLFQCKRNKNNFFIGLILMSLFASHLFVQIYADKGNHTDCIRYQFVGAQ